MICTVARCQMKWSKISLACCVMESCLNQLNAQNVKPCTAVGAFQKKDKNQENLIAIKNVGQRIAN